MSRIGKAKLLFEAGYLTLQVKEELRFTCQDVDYHSMDS
jgi:hypothetical protein